MKILLLTSWFLVLLYLRFQSKWNIRRSMREAEKKKESDTDNYSSDDDDILGKTRTEFPSRGMRGNAKEPDQNHRVAHRDLRAHQGEPQCEGHA